MPRIDFAPIMKYRVEGSAGDARYRRMARPDSNGDHVARHLARRDTLLT